MSSEVIKNKMRRCLDQERKTLNRLKLTRDLEAICKPENEKCLRARV